MPKVYVVNNEYLANMKVFVVNNEYLADIKIYITNNEYQADTKVFFVSNEYLADVKVYIVPSEYLLHSSGYSGIYSDGDIEFIDLVFGCWKANFISVVLVAFLSYMLNWPDYLQYILTATPSTVYIITFLVVNEKNDSLMKFLAFMGILFNIFVVMCFITN